MTRTKPFHFLILSVFSLTLLFSFTASPALAHKPGVTILWGDGSTSQLEGRFERMKAVGLTEARIDWEWRAVEKKQGTYDWSAMDRLVTLAHKHGITLLPIVHYAPEWALPKKRKPSDVYEMAPKPDAFPAYAAFLAASIDRYGPNGNASVTFTPIKNWQIWNEPNIPQFWGPSPNPADFVNLMTTVEKTLGSRRSTIRIIHAGLSKADFSFLWQLWDKDPKYGRLFDVMALHPYFFNPQGGVRAVDQIDGDEKEYATLGFIGSSSDHGFLSKVFNIQLFLTLKGTPKPIWITEIGFMAGNKNPYAITEAKEVELAKETLAFIDTKLGSEPFGRGARGDIAANVERVYWFTLDDYGFPNDTGNFGIYRMDGTVRPLADVIQNHTH